MFRRQLLKFAAVLALLSPVPVMAQDDAILVQSTTSTDNSGFYDYILPIFTGETGIKVNVVAVGTGQAIRNAANGDADVLLVHAKPDEEKFVADGFGVERKDLMYNDFVLIGPSSDPAGLAEADGLEDALKRLAVGAAPFVSRGDDSGTNKAELALWSRIGAAPAGQEWYRETGSGMGATIRIAVELGGYTLSDRATWAAYADKGESKILFEGDPALFNQYGIILVNPEKYPHVKVEAGQTFIDWLTGEHGQQLIADFKIDGQQLFYPNAVD